MIKLCIEIDVWIIVMTVSNFTVYSQYDRLFDSRHHVKILVISNVHFEHNQNKTQLNVE